MANEGHVALLRKGANEWNAWRAANPNVVPDLEGANLRRVNLVDVDLTNAQLMRADLTEATLSLARLEDADLRDATLLDVRLAETRLAGADLRKAVLVRASLTDTDLRRAKLDGADLSYALLVSADLSSAQLTGCTVYGISAWDLTTDERTDQRDLVVSRPDEPTVQVDDIEVAQFIRLLMTHTKLRNVFNAVNRRSILLLGRFTDGGIDRLRALARELRVAGYLPMMFDFERPDCRNYTETVQTLAGLSRFVIADLSGSSVPQELYATVPHFKIPFVPLVQKGKRAYAMVADIIEYPWVLEPVRYDTWDDLLKNVPDDILKPAEQRHQERQALLDRLFSDDSS